MRKIILTTLFVFLLVQLQSQHSIIPIPVEYISTAEVFSIKGKLDIVDKSGDIKVRKYASNFASIFSIMENAEFHEKNEEKRELILEVISPYNEEIGEEGYFLDITSNAIKIKANSSSGFFYAFQTIKQMIPEPLDNAHKNSIEITGCRIKDYPRFKWRGLMLDVSRHFFKVDEVKAYIDKMSQYKFNVFHWHLTDDEGWRIEIKSLPKLTEIGAWRVERYGRFGKNRVYPKKGEKATYGGFYTQDQVKEIIKYASDRNITIVPEIDMPGHSMAALAAYPELSVKKEPKFVSPGAKFAEWYDNGSFEMLIENTLNPCDEKVYEFADKVFTEIAQLFPGEYIHMGGDECYHGYWDANSDVQKFMKKNKIKDSHELQAYFVGRINKIISSKGKKMIGWDEIIDGELDKDAAVMSWRGMKGGIKAAKQGYNVVMSPTTYAYLDYTQGDHTVETPIYADLSLEKSYSFEPVPKGVDPKYIMGGQGNLWTEEIATLSFAYYMTYPRAFALAETLWSPKENKGWDSFISRTEKHFSRFDNTNTNISKAVYDPIVNVFKKGGKLMCELKNPIEKTEIYYTIDNTYPVKYGLKYTKPFEIPIGKLNLRAQVFRNGKALGRQLKIDRKELEKRAEK